ncbi:MAG TPA: hypothetical protein VHO69_09930 [Phototrophicaceae bacterium]|nr:hypothetical protein [Phototrophicaceae bacterium]
MMIRKLLLVGAVIGVIAFLLLILLPAPQSAGAQTNPAGLRALLERLNTAGSTYTIQFAAPVAAGETLWTLPDPNRRLTELGDDYVCFSQPWNDGNRIHCTPYSNIVSISYLSP